MGECSAIVTLRDAHSAETVSCLQLLEGSYSVLSGQLPISPLTHPSPYPPPPPSPLPSYLVVPPLVLCQDKLKAAAASLAVPNAFGSLMAQEGAVGLNASTSQDATSEWPTSACQICTMVGFRMQGFTTQRLQRLN